MNKIAATRILRKLPRENAFYFFTSIGNYTGKYASSLEEFVKKIQEVNVKSLQFHLCRRDFEKWAAQTLEDEELANQIQELQKNHPCEDVLQDQFYSVISKRYGELRKEISS